jgi:hypothetical protein
MKDVGIFKWNDAISREPSRFETKTILTRLLLIPYVGWKFLRDLLGLYSFEAAQVHLVPIVPRIFPLQQQQEQALRDQ